jgi:pyruvate dehydrogenase E2 component (dihydrolipoamide acetyltransferase)
MTKELTMPALSPSMSEGTLAKWLKKEGDTITVGEVIAEVETDKATMDLEAFEDGTLLKILAKEGTPVPVNGLIAVVGHKGEKVSADLLKPKSDKKTEVKKEVPKPNPEIVELPVLVSAAVPPTPIATLPGRTKVSPLAKKIAQEKGVNLSTLPGSGPGGRIVKRDVLGAQVNGHSRSIMENGPITKDERIPLSNMRRVIARRLLESKTQIPHFYLEVEINAGPLVATRASVNEYLESAGKKLKLSMNDFVLKASVEALRKVPGVNASFEGDAIRQHGAVHMSFAVAVADGLLTPVIRDAHSKSLVAISQEAKTLANKAKEGKLTPEEYGGGTFTVSNLGMMGIDRFRAIINPPQAGILAIGNVMKRAVVNDQDQIVVGQRMSLNLSCDHRVVDGALGAIFLAELRNLLENPAVLLL